MKSGIYEIRNTANGKRYIGSAASLRGRKATHLSYLRRGIHHNTHLQRAWNQYGEPSFTFTTLLYCAKDSLLMYEQLLIDAMEPEYNLSPTAGSTLGVRWSPEAKERNAARPNDHFKGRKHSAETLARMSAAKRGNTATKGKRRSPAAIARSAAAHVGMKRSQETRDRIARAMRESWARKQNA